MKPDSEPTKNLYVIYDRKMTEFLDKLIYYLKTDNRIDIFIKALNKIDVYGGDTRLFRQTVDWILSIKKYIIDNHYDYYWRQLDETQKQNIKKYAISTSRNEYSFIHLHLPKELKTKFISYMYGNRSDVSDRSDNSDDSDDSEKIKVTFAEYQYVKTYSCSLMDFDQMTQYIASPDIIISIVRIISDIFNGMAWDQLTINQRKYIIKILDPTIKKKKKKKLKQQMSLIDYWIGSDILSIMEDYSMTNILAKDKMVCRVEKLCDWMNVT